MIYEVMRHCRNFFPARRISGEFKIEGGCITLEDVKVGQYILIEGSALNDGVYLYPGSELHDEDFSGVVTVCNVPKDFIALVDEIETYQRKNGDAVYQSESFGGYTYTRPTNASGNVAGWTDVFKQRLNVWRKI